MSPDPKPDPWLSRAQAHDRALVRLETDITAASEAALADVIAELWRLALDEPVSLPTSDRTSRLLASGLSASAPPEITGLEQEADRSWRAALRRWLRPLVSAGFARQYTAATGGVGLSVDDPVLVGWWAAVEARLADTIDRLVAAIRATVAAHPDATIPELRDKVARVLQLDAPTASARAEIDKVEAELLDLSLSGERRDALFTQRLKVLGALARWDTATAQARALRAIAAVAPAGPGGSGGSRGRLLDMARRIEPPKPRSVLESDLASLDEQLYRNPALEGRVAAVRARRALLYKQAAASEETWRNTATRIARTESTGVLNGSTYAAAQAMERDQGIRLMKRWIATLDSKGGCDPRTRPTHCRANGQLVPLDQPFTVGGANLMYPGDPSGPPEEVIQCRCSHAAVTLEEDEEVARSLAASAVSGAAGSSGSRRPPGVPGLVWGIASRLAGITSPDRAAGLVAAVNQLRAVCTTGAVSGEPVDADARARACAAVQGWDALRVRAVGPAIDNGEAV